MSLDIQTINEHLKRQRINAAQHAQLSGGFAETFTGHLVVLCPECEKKTATIIPYLERFEETHFNCDQCGTVIEAQIDWETVRQIVDVKCQAIKSEGEVVAHAAA